MVSGSKTISMLVLINKKAILWNIYYLDTNFPTLSESLRIFKPQKRLYEEYFRFICYFAKRHTGLAQLHHLKQL